MKVWRVAHRTAKYDDFPSGPYACPETLPAGTVAALEEMYGEHTDSRHQTPYCDRRLRGISDHERCGFISRTHLDEWFSGWHKTLADNGFIVWVYELHDEEDVRVGDDGQVVFTPLWATGCGTEELNTVPVQLHLW